MKDEMDTTTANSVIKKWVELYSDQLYSWAYHKTSDKEVTEDLVQETFLAAVHSFHQYKEKSEPKTWLLAILKNKIADNFRKVYRKNGSKIVSIDKFFGNNGDWLINQRPQKWEEEDEQHLLDDIDFKGTLTDCLGKLPAKGRISILSKFIEGKKSDEICQELNISTTHYWQIMQVGS